MPVSPMTSVTISRTSTAHNLCLIGMRANLSFVVSLYVGQRSTCTPRRGSFNEEVNTTAHVDAKRTMESCAVDEESLANNHQKAYKVDYDPVVDAPTNTTRTAA